MTENNSAGSVDLEVLVDLEQQFYDAGYEDGYEHGRLHGRIEGRDLGVEKGFEMWEEVGFYEGFAKLWKSASEKEDGDSRISHNTKVLLDCISQFPMKNPSHLDSADVDIPRLFGQIRARYKMLCSAIGVKPSLSTSQSHTQTSSTPPGENDSQKSQPGIWSIGVQQEKDAVDYSF